MALQGFDKQWKADTETSYRMAIILAFVQRTEIKEHREGKGKGKNKTCPLGFLFDCLRR